MSNLWIAHSFALVIALTISPICGQAAIGQSDGGGGAAVLCYKSVATKNQVLMNLNAASNTLDASDLNLDQLTGPPVLADIFDVSRSHGFMNVRNSEVVTDSVQKRYSAIASLDPKFYSLFSPSITADNQWQAYSSGIVSIMDAYYVGKFPQNCIVAQVAFYDDLNQIVNYDSRITALMDVQNKTALKLHEDLYSFFRAQVRKYNAALDDNSCVFQSRLLPGNSDTVRPLVAYLMTNQILDHATFTERSLRVALGASVRHGFFRGNYVSTDYTNIDIPCGLVNRTIYDILEQPSN